jgi:hypothetical protein
MTDKYETLSVKY